MGEVGLVGALPLLPGQELEAPEVQWEEEASAEGSPEVEGMKEAAQGTWSL